MQPISYLPHTNTCSEAGSKITRAGARFDLHKGSKHYVSNDAMASYTQEITPKELYK